MVCLTHLKFKRVLVCWPLLWIWQPSWWYSGQRDSVKWRQLKAERWRCVAKRQACRLEWESNTAKGRLLKSCFAQKIDISEHLSTTISLNVRTPSRHQLILSFTLVSPFMLQQQLSKALCAKHATLLYEAIQYRYVRMYVCVQWNTECMDWRTEKPCIEWLCSGMLWCVHTFNKHVQHYTVSVKCTVTTLWLLTDLRTVTLHIRVHYLHTHLEVDIVQESSDNHLASVRAGLRVDGAVHCHTPWAARTNLQ